MYGRFSNFVDLVILGLEGSYEAGSLLRLVFWVGLCGMIVMEFKLSRSLEILGSVLRPVFTLPSTLTDR